MAFFSHSEISRRQFLWLISIPQDPGFLHALLFLGERRKIKHFPCYLKQLYSRTSLSTQAFSCYATLHRPYNTLKFLEKPFHILPSNTIFSSKHSYTSLHCSIFYVFSSHRNVFLDLPCLNQVFSLKLMADHFMIFVDQSSHRCIHYHAGHFRHDF